MNDIERAIETLKQVSDLDTKLHLNISNYDLLTAIEALQEKAERENPKPLTLEEVKQRKWVWIDNDTSRGNKGWAKVLSIYGGFLQLCGLDYYFKDYGEKYLAYDYEPTDRKKDNGFYNYEPKEATNE